MSSTFVLYIVAIVSIVIIIYLIGVIIRKKNDGRIAALEEQKNTLLSLPIAEEIEEVKQLALVGHSLEDFQDWENKWQEIDTELLPAIDGQLEDAQNFNDTFNFVKTSQELTKVETQLQTIQSDLGIISEGLGVLKEQEDKNSARVKYALDLYEELQKTISAQEKAFGPSLPEVSKQLSNIEAEFSEFVALNSAGDPIEAADILERAEEHTIALGQITEKIPDLAKELTETLPEQLEDLETGYAKLLEDNYQFGDQPIESRFQTIRESLSDASDDLANLELDKAESTGLDVQERIDALYDLFEKEIAAHKLVVKHIKVIPDYLAHNKTNNEKLAQELQRLNRQYILDDKDSQSIKNLAKELAKIEADVLPGIVEEQTPEQPFSVLETVYGNTMTNLGRIEQDQLDVLERLKTVEKIEDNSRKELDKDINRLHVIKRFMEKRNLPGIPQEFLSIFFTTSSQLEALMTELDRNRIDIKAVERLSESATKAMGVLEETAYRVVQHATLTEQLLQYSNRYRSFEPNVQTSFDNAFYLFEQNFDYQGAFEEISYALEIVEPGVTDRFVHSYEKTRETIRF